MGTVVLVRGSFGGSVHWCSTISVAFSPGGYQPSAVGQPGQHGTQVRLFHDVKEFVRGVSLFPLGTQHRGTQGDAGL
jgi:hypothetical protein